MVVMMGKILEHMLWVNLVLNHIVVSRLTSHIDFTDYCIFFFLLHFLYVVAVVSSEK